MKKLIMTAVLALSFALPLVAISTKSSADVWFKVNNPGSHVDLLHGERKIGVPGRIHIRGVKCRIPHGQYVKSGINFYTGNLSVFWDMHKNARRDFVYVSWMKKLGVLEWHWKSAHNRWCPHWNRKGFAERRLLRKVGKPGGLWIN